MSKLRSRLPPSFSVTVGIWIDTARRIRDMLARGVVLSPADFFAGVRKRLKASLPADLRKFNSGRGRGRLMKVHYGNPDFHYEVWHHTGAGRLEVGLHFEGSARDNERAFDFFRTRMVEVKASLPHAELEPWDRGWKRLYETIPAAQLEDILLERSADLAGSYITTLQPLLALLLED
jgi:hypothetical protein